MSFSFKASNRRYSGSSLQWVVVAVGRRCSGSSLQWVVVAVGRRCSGSSLQWVVVAFTFYAKLQPVASSLRNTKVFRAA
jgi:hypothetical protein